MDVQNLTSLVTALRAETANAAITPESLGALLQQIVDILGQTSSDTDVSAIKSWKTNVSKITQVITAIQRGSADRDALYLSASLASLANGSRASVANGLALPAATSEHAGVMTSRHVEALNTATNNIENLKKSITVSGGSSSVTNIVCDAKDGYLVVKGAKALTAAGFVPYIFRYTLKRNRSTTRDGVGYRGPKRRGWHIFYKQGLARVTDSESIQYNDYDSETKTFKGNWGTSPWYLIHPRVTWDREDNIASIKVGFGKKTIEAVGGRRFKFGIAFGPKQRKDKFDPSTLVTNIAPFNIHVRKGIEQGKYEIDFCL